MSEKPLLFTMIRNIDESGVSGTGRVLDGVIFHTGQVVTCWRTDIEGDSHGYSSLGVYPSWKAFKHIHIDSHPRNKTEVIWADSAFQEEERLAKYRCPRCKDGFIDTDLIVHKNDLGEIHKVIEHDTCKVCGYSSFSTIR